MEGAGPWTFAAAPTLLRINYRTSHQIRVHADRLLPATVSDVDGNTEGRRGTVSIFDGPPPNCRSLHRFRS